jgi:hypothetical protein
MEHGRAGTWPLLHLDGGLLNVLDGGSGNLNRAGLNSASKLDLQRAFHMKSSPKGCDTSKSRGMQAHGRHNAWP